MGNKRIHTSSYNLELRNTFRISHSARDVQPTFIVALTDGEFTGYGEAAATSYYGTSVERMTASINAVEHLVLKNLHRSPEELWEITCPYLKNDSFAQCALDIAMHDLHGKRLGLPLYKLWGLNLNKLPMTSYTIGIDAVENMVRKIREFPWPIYKIKLGTEDDVAIIKELRKHTSSVFRVDANTAWSADQTIRYADLLKELNVEFIEQPLPPEDLTGMKKVLQNAALPVIADESCITEDDLEKCVGYFHGVNIKLTKCGGLTPARKMIRRGKELGLKIMVGCMTESTVGISAIAHLLPLLDFVDMDGSLLLKNDIAAGITFKGQKVEFPNRNGTGVVLL